MLQQRKVKIPPDSLIDLPKDNDDLTFGLALQLKDLYWTAEAFQAEQAIEIAMQGQKPTKEQAKKVSTWLTWLKTASYQQTFDFE